MSGLADLSVEFICNDDYMHALDARLLMFDVFTVSYINLERM
jgi:hypothetical protein